MAKFILGKKLNMTQKFAADATVSPVTVVSAGPCFVVQVKGDKDGYKAVQIGYGFKKKLNKAQAGHLKNLSNFRYLKEFRVANPDSFERGKFFGVSSFQAGDIVDARATSKGKGFQGVVKRHGFAGSPASHGHKDQLRMPGSIGATDPARVFKGTRMGGRMGTDTVKLKNLKLIEVDTENNLLYIKGAIPGHRGTLVEITCLEGEISFLSKEIKSSSQEKATEKTASQKNEASKDTEKKEEIETPIKESDKPVVVSEKATEKEVTVKTEAKN